MFNKVYLHFTCSQNQCSKHFPFKWSTSWYSSHFLLKTNPTKNKNSLKTCTQYSQYSLTTLSGKMFQNNLIRLARMFAHLWPLTISQLKPDCAIHFSFITQCFNVGWYVLFWYPHHNPRKIYPQQGYTSILVFMGHYYYFKWS